MGFCFSRPAVDDDATEQSALLGNQYYSGRPERVVQNDPFAHFSAEELAQREEEERLRALERQTTEALINISQRGDFAHAQTFASTSGSTRDYTEILREFNQKIKLPMVTLTGPAEFPRGRSTNTDVVAVLAEGRILDADVRRLDDGIDFIIDAISDTHIRSEGDLIVPLSASSEASTN
ncbi:hypothetical protein IWW39_006176 [Coemansia spiralis]|uniref:Uncharacterized protein n=1 Tax=Coemansia spiralis TaxID=417178 RepID=A0A9W8L017_9FUNG|nr:hypothetical protein IWW39_006176 [Coemansia spiralis]